MTSETDRFMHIALHGEHARPATVRYTPSTCVVCDRCGRRNLLACYGIGGEDLCLYCVDVLQRQNAEEQAWRARLQTIPQHPAVASASSVQEIGLPTNILHFAQGRGPPPSGPTAK